MKRLEIAPALEPEEWKHRRYGAVSIDHVDGETHVVVTDPDRELVSVSGSADVFALMALASRWELLVPSGSLLPTGAQHGAIKNGNITAIQLTYVARPTFAITSTLAWARSRDVATAGDPKLDVFTYDVGAEARAPRWMASSSVTLSPFAGVGAGGRSYNYRKLDVDATHNLAAYASAGGELGIRRVRIRLEARDYVSGFKPLRGEGLARTGNDVVLMAGVHLVSR